MGGLSRGSKLSDSPPAVAGVSLDLFKSILREMEKLGERVKIQECLANSFFIWLPVEIDLNISGPENILNCVSLIQPSSVRCWDRMFRSIQRY